MVSKALVVMAMTVGVGFGPAPLAHADRAEPVPLYGYYDAFIDHTRQTFNGAPTPSEPSTQLGVFTTRCDTDGCVVEWLRETEIVQNPGAARLYEYRWNNNRWESSGEYQFHCGADGQGGTTPAFRTDFLTPTGGGSFSGERTFTVEGAGCPGEGAGTYWLPFSLTPVEPPAGSIADP